MSLSSSDVEALVVECLDRMESEGDVAVDALCAAHPELAASLQSRIRTLRAAGLIGGFGSKASATGSGADFPDRLGDFELISRLGSGGMGVVYRARQTSLDREVALKLIRPEHMYFEGARDRFRREVEATARLQHPGIVPVYVVGEERGIPYFAMELVAGASLGDVLEKLGSRDIATLSGADLLAQLPGEGSSPLYDGTWCECIARIVREVAEALEHAHRRGVLHRDMKPSNVMITRTGRVMIVDFGLSSNQGAKRLTQSGSHLGSMPYMPPEIVAGGTASSGARSDVYSLGASLYELLTHALPYAADNTAAMLQKIDEGRAIPPRRLNPTIPRDLAVVCLTAMDREPSRRYDGAAALAADLTRVLEHRPIEARPAGPLLRAARFAQRRPAHAAVIALALLLLLGVPTVLWIQQRAANAEIRAALDDARAQRDRARSSLDVAAQSIEDLLSRVGDRDLDNVPGMEDLRAKILGDALTLNEDLMRIGEGQEMNSARVAIARARVGEIRRQMGRNEEALTLLGEAVDALEAADPSELRPGELDWQTGLAHMRRAQVLRKLGHNEDSLADTEEAVRRIEKADLGPARESERTSLLRNAMTHSATTLFILGRTEESLKRQREGVELARREAERTNDAHSLLMLGASLCSLSYQLIEGGQPDEALPVLEEAVSVETRSLELDPLSSTARSALGDALINLGSTTWRLTDRRGSIPHFRRALEILEGLVRDFPSNTEYATALNDCRASLAGALGGDEETHDESIALMKDAMNSQEALCKARPDELRSRATWAIATANLGGMTGPTDPTEGIALFHRAMEILEPVRANEPQNPQFAQYMGEWWLGICEIEARSGSLPRAIEALEKAQSMYPVAWRTLRRLTGKWLMLSATVREADQIEESDRDTVADRCLQRALATFSQAVDAGYSDVADLQSERVLDPLRDMPEWAELEHRVLERVAEKGG